MYKYQKIIDALSDVEMNSAIREMVDKFDLTGKFVDLPDDIYNVTSGEKEFKKYFSITSEVSNLIETIIQKEFDEEKYRLGGNNVPLEDIDFVLLDSSTPEQDLRKKIIEMLYRSLLDYLVTKAKQITENREYLRIPVGNVVDFKDCMLFNKFRGKVEFYKDGGWGIAEKDGTVLVKNHLMGQPSKTNPLNSCCSDFDSPYRIVQDRDTKKYGIISFESFYEIIPCLYNGIDVSDSYYESKRYFYIMAKKDGKWGCFDENCALIIDYRYDIIRPYNGFIECIKGAKYLSWESSIDDYATEITGKKDLYDKEGVLLIGGYDVVDMSYGYLQFYFGTLYEEYFEEEADSYGHLVKLSKLRLNYNNSLCLVLDKDFKTIIRNENGFYRIPKGIVFESVQEVDRIVPPFFLFRFRVDLYHFDKGFIYLHDFYGKQYLVPEYIAKGFDSPEKMKEHKERQIVEMRNSIADVQKRIEEMQRLMGDEVSDSTEVINNDSFSCPFTNENQEIFEDDEIVTIIKVDKEKNIEWHDYVDEIGITNYPILSYRTRSKIGVYDENGLHSAVFDAISLNSSDGKTYVASIELCHETSSPSNENPNKIFNVIIHYYRINTEGNLTQMDDDWNVFNPTEYKWFPYNFISSFYPPKNDSSFWHSGSDYDWTDEDAWDAMTDGMYGDYPGPGWDPECFGF